MGINLNTLLSQYDAIIIPDIQRDYVLGSNVANVQNLLLTMAQSARQEKPFHFSCIMGHVEDNRLMIYDGQQRLTTLVFLCAFLLKEQPDNFVPPELQKFRFMYRADANHYLNALTENEEAPISIVDFTTYSIQQLKKTFEQLNTYIRAPLTLEYLLNQVCMERVLIDKVGDVEQFFIDLNDGLDLTDYEIYKAELYHKAKKLLGQDFQCFALSMENEWLQLFKKLKKTGEVEEEIEMLFVQYCLQMMLVEEGYPDDNKLTDLSWIETRHLYKLKMIMSHIVKLDTNKAVKKSFVHYSCGKIEHDRKDVAVGVFWKITPFNYDDMLLTFLRSFYEKVSPNQAVYQVKFEAKYDVMIWAYLSHLEQPTHDLYEHLRTMKLLLNRNLIKNTTAYYDNWHRVWYASYGVYGIPSYYTDIKDNFTQLTNNKSANNYLRTLICLNQQILNLSNSDFEYTTENTQLNEIIRFEQQIRKTEYYSPLIRDLQDLSFINGFVDGLLDDHDEPIIIKEALLNMLECPEHPNQEETRNVVDRLISRCTYLNVENVEKLLFKDNIKMKWHSYTKNISTYKEDVNIVTQALTDIFVDKSFTPLLRALIREDYCEGDRDLSFKLLYLRGHSYMNKTGFYTNDDRVVTVRNWTGPQYGLFSTKALYDYPFEEYLMNQQISPLTANYEGDSDIKISMYRKSESKSFQQAVENNAYYCKQRWIYYALLQPYLKRPRFDKQSNQQLINEKTEIIILENKTVYVPDNIIIDFHMKQ